MAGRTASGSSQVDVVIPTYNARDLVLDCLHHLDDEVIADRIVVDDVSGDDTAAAVRAQFPDAKVVELDEHRGLAHALNAGVAEGSAPYVLFINNDLVTESGSVTKLVEYLAADPEAACAAGRLLDPETGMTQDGYRPHDYPTLSTLAVRLLGVERHWPGNPWSGGHLRRPLGDDEVVRVWQQPAGACVIVSRDVLERIGGWDESYWFWYEDVDLALRLARVGPTLWVGPATFIHAGMHSTSSWPKHEQHRRLYQGTLLYAQRHLPGWQATVVAMLMIAVCIPRMAAGILLGGLRRRIYGGLIRNAVTVARGGPAEVGIPAELSRRRARSGGRIRSGLPGPGA